MLVAEIAHNLSSFLYTNRQLNTMNHMRNIKEMLSIPTGSRWIAYHYFSPTENNFAQGCCQWFSMCHITYDSNFVCASVCWCDFFKHCLCFVDQTNCVFVFSSHIKLVGAKQSTGMGLPAASPVLQTLRFSLGLSFGLKILKACHKIWVCHPGPHNKVHKR